jgi:hypothetical protein
MPRKQIRKGGCQKGFGRRAKKVQTWATKKRQKGGFLFTGLAILGSLISAGIAAAAPAVATGAISAASGFAVTKAIEAGQRGRGRKLNRRRR